MSRLALVGETYRRCGRDQGMPAPTSPLPRRGTPSRSTGRSRCTWTAWTPWTLRRLAEISGWDSRLDPAAMHHHRYNANTPPNRASRVAGHSKSPAGVTCPSARHHATYPGSVSDMTSPITVNVWAPPRPGRRQPFGLSTTGARARRSLMSMVCGLDLHRQQITFDAVDVSLLMFRVEPSEGAFILTPTSCPQASRIRVTLSPRSAQHRTSSARRTGDTGRRRKVVPSVLSGRTDRATLMRRILW
jgi:hypothetical protein